MTVHAFVDEGRPPLAVAPDRYEVLLKPRPGRHDPMAVVADIAHWPTGLLRLLNDRFPRPARQTAHRREQGCTGSHFSPLMAAERRWDSPDEARLCLIGDVSPMWWGYWCQVLTVPYEFEGRQRTAYPDFLVRLADGSFTAIEVKPAKILARDRERHAAITRACAAHGLSYRVVTDVWLRAEPRFSNCHALHAGWNVPIADNLIAHVRCVMKIERPGTVGELMALRSMKGVQQGATYACALRGGFRIDIEATILDVTSSICEARKHADRHLLSAGARRPVGRPDPGNIAGKA